MRLAYTMGDLLGALLGYKKSVWCLYHEMMSKNAIDDVMFVDQCFDQNMKVITVNCGELGVQKALGVALVKNDKRENVAVIPAFCGDIFGVEPIIKELFLSKNVFSISWPDSNLSTMTDEFVAKVVADVEMDAYVIFFHKWLKETMLKLHKDKIEIVAYSTGCAIMLFLLHKFPEFKSRIKKLTLIAPAGLVERNYLLMLGGILNEFRALLSLKGFLFNGIIMWHRRKIQDKHNRKKTFNSTLKNIVLGTARNKLFDSLNQMLESNIDTKIVICLKDKITGGTRVKEAISSQVKNKLLQVVVKKWLHVGAITYFDELF